MGATRIHAPLLAALACWAATAHAQPAPPSASIAQAEILFRDAKALMEEQRFAEACDAFAESYRLDPRVSVQLNLANCRERNGQLATAWGVFLDVQAQTRGSTDPTLTQLHDVARQHAEALEARVSKLVVAVPPASRRTGLVVTRDGEPIATAALGRPLPVDGGTIVLEATAPGAIAWKQTVAIATERETKHVDVPPLADAHAGDAVTTQEPEGALAARGLDVPTTSTRGDERAAPRQGPTRWIIAGGSGVAFGAAVLLELSGRSRYEDAEAEVSDQARRDDLFASANNRRYLAIGAAGLGVGLAAAAVWLTLRPSPGPSAVARGPRVTPSFDGMTARIDLTGAF